MTSARPGLVTPKFAAVALTWGSSFLFIKVGLEGLSPGQVVLGRVALGALALAAVSAVGRRSLPRERVVWGHLLVMAMTLCVVPFLLFAWAEQHISSGLASIYNATTPLMTVLVATAALPAERLTRSRALGLALGFAGVLMVLAPWRGLGGGSLLGQLACLGATACYGVSFVYLRRYVAPRGLPSLTVATVQIGLAAVVMLALVPWIATTPVDLAPRVVLSVLALGVLGTGLAYVWNTDVVAAWGATGASTVTYLTPVVGVALGALLLDEWVSWNEPVGAAAVVLGILVSQGRIGRRRRAGTATRTPRIAA